MQPDKILAYGTLRLGHYNHDRFDLNYLETIKLKGYKLYDLGPYPMVIKDEESSVVVDVLECDERTKRAIDMMERGAGYKIDTVVLEDSSSATIYYFSNRIENAKEITSGDYNRK